MRDRVHDKGPMAHELGGATPIVVVDTSKQASVVFSCRELSTFYDDNGPERRVQHSRVSTDEANDSSCATASSLIKPVLDLIS